MTDQPPAAEHPAIRADWFQDRGLYHDALAAALRWVLDDPPADEPRLRYAEVCDRIAEAPCPMCRGEGRLWWERSRNPGFEKCPDCSGSGRGGDRWRARAEFVRVQVELAAWKAAAGPRFREVCEVARKAGLAIGRGEHWGTPEGEAFARDYPGNERAKALRRREGELLTDQRWLDWSGGLAELAGYHWPNMDGPWDWEFHRGFVESITAPLATLFGDEECSRCEGDGFVQTLPDGRVVPSADCPACSGTGRTPGAAPTIFAAQPVTAVTLSDRAPSETPSGRWQWFENVGLDDTDTLPSELYRLLPREPGDEEHGDPPRLTKPTRDAALAALSRAAVARGRAVADGCSHEVPCERCAGAGAVREKIMPTVCPACSGSGRVARPGLPPLP